MVYILFKDNMQLEFIFRMIAACIAGFAVGLERSRNQKSAGIRTYVIVALGAAIFTLVSKYGFLDVLGQENVRVDVARVACNIAPGVGFLGAGTIYMRGDRITGLTTAAGIWVIAAIGMAMGNGMYIIGFAVTILILVLQTIMQHNSGQMFGAKVYDRITIQMDDQVETLEALEELLAEHKIDISTTHIKRHKDQTMTYSMSVRVPEKLDIAEMVSEIYRVTKAKSIDM